MKVYFVGAGPGDAELLTVKAKRLLENCKALIYAGSLVSDEVIALAPSSARRWDSARMTLEEVIGIMIEARDKGMDVVRLHSGDPSIYGAIGEQISELDKLGIGYEVVPGISSFQASAAELNLELTAPGISQTIILTRMAGRTPVPEEQDIALLAESRSTLCVFLSVSKIGELMNKLAKSYGPDCPTAVVSRASWPDQRIICGTVGDIAARTQAVGIKKTAMIIVGRALEGPREKSRLYDGAFSHEYRKATVKGTSE